MPSPPSLATTEAAPLFNKIFLVQCAAVLCFFSGYHMLTPVLPLVFQNRWVDIGLLMAIFMVGSVTMRPFAGALSDSLDKKQLMLVGAAVFALVPQLYQLSLPVPVYYVLRILHGLSFGLFVTVSSSYLVQHLPKTRKGEGLSYYSNAIKLAMAFSPALGLGLFGLGQAWLIGGGMLPFLSATLFGLLSLVFVLLLPKAPVSSSVPNPALPKLKSSGWRLFRQGLSKKGVFPGLVMASNSMAFGMLMPFIPLLGAEKHLQLIGWFYPVYAVTLIASRFVAGKASDQLGREPVALPALLAVSVSLLLMGLANNDILFLLASGLYGFSAGVVQPVLMAVAADRVSSTGGATGKGDHGAVMATFTLCTDLGIAAGMVLMGNLGQQWQYETIVYWVSLMSVLGAIAFGAQWWLTYRQRQHPKSPTQWVHS